MTAMLTCTRLANPWLGLSLMFLAAGCSGSDTGIPDEQLGGLVVAPADQQPPLQVERMAQDSQELVRATTLPHQRVGALLGPHRFRSTAKVEIREGEEIREAMETEVVMEFASAERFHARSENSKEYGREVYFVDGQLYLAPRYSKFHRRAPERTAEPGDLRDLIYGELGAHLELLARGIDVADKGSGAVEAGGQTRPTRTFAIAKAASMRPASGETLRHRTWRDRVQVTEASGELSVDEEHGVVLHAAVHGAVTFDRDGRSFVMTFDVEHDIADIGSAIEIAAPADDRWVATPLRSREVEERDALLEGIAPATRKQEPRKASSEAKGESKQGGGKAKGESK